MTPGERFSQLTEGTLLEAPQWTEPARVLRIGAKPCRKPKTALKGGVHGNTIELENESGFPDGQELSVTVQPVSGKEPLAPGEGLRRSFGVWAEDAEELDRDLEWNRQQRKIGRPEIEP